MEKLSLKYAMLYVSMILFAGLASSFSKAGHQQEEALSHSVASTLRRSVGASYRPRLTFASPTEAEHWLTQMSARLRPQIPDPWLQQRLLTAIHYEASRAGLDPQLVLAVIHVESNFRLYAISEAGARGLMQVMPFWVKVIGQPEHNLFHLQTNLRYGCTILRHYLDRENGDIARALARYNGSLGRQTYSDKVLRAWQQEWQWP